MPPRPEAVTILFDEMSRDEPDLARITRHVVADGGLSAGDKARNFERSWNTAEKTALLCHYLAGRLKGIAAGEAHTYGLFHDRGIPVLMQRFPEYQDTLRRANEAAGVPFTDPDVSGGARNLIAIGHLAEG